MTAGRGDGLVDGLRAALATGMPVSGRVAVAELTDLPAVVAVDLAGDDAPRVRQALVRRDNLPAVVQVQLAHDERVGIREQLARRADLSDEALQVLAGDHSARVVAAVAGREDLPAELMAALLADPVPQVRGAAAANPSLTVAAMLAMEKDPRVSVVARLALNPAAPPWLVQRLAQHRSATVRAAVAGRDCLPDEVRAALRRDRSSQVRWMEREHDPSDVPDDDWWVMLDSTDLDLAFTYQDVNQDGLDYRIYAPDYTASRSHSQIASDRTSPRDVVIAYTSDPDPAVRAAAAANPTLPHRVRTTMVDDPDPQVRRAVGRRTNDPNVLHQLTDDPDRSVRVAAATNTHTRRSDLHMLAADPYPSVRAAVAANPASPATAITALAADPDPKIAQAAITHRYATPAVMALGLDNPTTRGHVLTYLTPDLLRATLSDTLPARTVIAVLRELVPHDGAAPAVPFLHDRDRRVRTAAWQLVADHPRGAPPDVLREVISRASTPPAGRVAALKELLTVAGVTAVMDYTTHPNPDVQAATTHLIADALT